jgi:hypothetical protein
VDDPWALRYLWPIPLREVADWASSYESWLSPGTGFVDGAPWLRASVDASDADTFQWPGYRYANGFVAERSVWGESSVEASGVVFREQRESSLRAPSRKALLFDMSLAYLRNDRRLDAVESIFRQRHAVRRGVLTVDGAAAIRSDLEAAAPFPNAASEGRQWLYHDTRDGIAGRDF